MSLAEALEDFGKLHPEQLQDVDGAMQWILGEDDLGSLNQADVQRFLWFSLPLKWLTDNDHHRQVVAGLAAFLEHCGCDRYAEICRSEGTTAILDAYLISDAAGKKAALRAQDNSGIEPLDTDSFEWSNYMSVVEARTNADLSVYLEMAIQAGDLNLRAKSWKVQQKAIIEVQLDLPRIDLKGRSYREAITQERREWWFQRQRSAAFRDLLGARLEDLATSPTDVPVVAQLQWFLGTLVDGERLTATGNLNRAYVQAVAGRCGWDRHPSPRPPASELDLPELGYLREVAARAGMTRVRAGQLLLTAVGRQALGDDRLLWTLVVRNLFIDAPIYRSAGLVEMALLAEGVPKSRLPIIVGDILIEQGWRDRSGVALTAREARDITYENLRVVRALKLLAVGDDFDDTHYRLTELGQALAAAMIRREVIGPCLTI